MAMTKKEKAGYDAIVQELRIQRALRWTGEQPGPDVHPKSGQEVTGFYYNTGYGDVRVEQGASTTVGHRRGAPSVVRTRECWSQNARPLFSTPLLAAKAARAVLEREFAQKLEKADVMIEAFEDNLTWPIEGGY